MRMMRHGRVRRFVRRAAVGATLAIPLVWIAGLFWCAIVTSTAAGAGLSTSRGTVTITLDPALKNWTGPACILGRCDPSWPLQWLPSVNRFGPGRSYSVPLWMLGLVLAAFAAWRLRADTVDPAQTCPACGYDRCGLLADAVCPECGGAENLRERVSGYQGPTDPM